MTNFSKLIKELLKPLPKNDYPALDTFTFLSCWIGFALDKSIVSMRDLCSRMVLQGINVNLSPFSKASKIRATSPFEKVIVELNKRLVAKKGIENARALFPIDSTIISLTSKLLWSQGWHQVKLFSGLNSITTEVVGILIHFGQGHDSKEGGKMIEAIPVNGVGVMDRGLASNQRITELLESSDKHFFSITVRSAPPAPNRIRRADVARRIWRKKAILNSKSSQGLSSTKLLVGN
jgi:hypothetical protein